MGVAGALIGVVVGAGVIFGAGWAVSGLTAQIVRHLASMETGLAVGWPVFWAYLLVVAPLLVWRTIRTGGEFYTQQVIDSGAFEGKPSNHSEWEYRADVATTALFGDLLFWGPRLIVDGCRRLFGREVIRSASNLCRASYVLAHLLRSNEAARTKALKFPNEPADAFQRNLRWLEAQDYIGVSSDGQRVWMGSQVREGLCKHLQIEPKRAKREGPLMQQRNRYMDKRGMVDIIPHR